MKCQAPEHETAIPQSNIAMAPPPLTRSEHRGSVYFLFIFTYLFLC